MGQTLDKPDEVSQNLCFLSGDRRYYIYIPLNVLTSLVHIQYLPTLGIIPPRPIHS